MISKAIGPLAGAMATPKRMALRLGVAALTADGCRGD
jgi:hypothetical protein